MKQGEEPGKVFHYQTFGMNLLTHALAKLYGLYDTEDPDRLSGFGKLLEDKLRNPIQGVWTYGNFDLQPQAKLNIFGNYTQIHSTARDMLRIGHLWLNRGRWNNTQVIPQDYLKGAKVTNPDILANEPEKNWKYGHAQGSPPWSHPLAPTASAAPSRACSCGPQPQGAGPST